MSRIEDFGERLKGAAKDRMASYRESLVDKRSDKDSLILEPLSRSFPEPDYQKLIEEGVDPSSLSFIRAVRDIIPPKPRKARSLLPWSSKVSLLRDAAIDVLRGAASPDASFRRLEASSLLLNRMAEMKGRFRLYEALGHDRSLKDFYMEPSLGILSGGEPSWEVKEIVQSKFRRVIASGKTPESASRKLQSLLEEREAKLREKPASHRRSNKIGIYSYKNAPEKGFQIGTRIRGVFVELAHFQFLEDARRSFRDEIDFYEDKLSRLRTDLPERTSENRSRTGPERYSGDVTPEVFQDTFGFRGVQFGNYVEGPRRQEDLNTSFAALIDLSEALRCAPSDLSLGGSLGLAFGARGRGGKRSFAAHYEPGEIVINLTKYRGAGSLAHEWFHALDNHVSRKAGGRVESYATQIPSGKCSPEGQPFSKMMEAIKSETTIRQRCLQLDRARSKPYFSEDVEIAARFFEAAIKDRLSQMGIINDYLVNIIDEDVFRAEAEIMGHAEDSYPYVKASETRVMREIFHGFLENVAQKKILTSRFPSGEAPSAKAIDRDQDIGSKPAVPLFMAEDDLDIQFD